MGLTRGVQRLFTREWNRLCADDAQRTGELLLLGCSAGADSMALMDLVASLDSGSPTLVLHYDHAQRPESAQESTFVAARALRYGFGFHTERYDGAKPLRSEADLRAARWNFFRRAAREHASRRLVLAHQADDRAETFLIRLLAGSGPTGLAAIRAREHFEELEVLRPLLRFRRAALRVYLTERGLDWRDDPTNDTQITKRSWIRHALVPFINERIGHDVAPHLVRAAELIEEETEFAESVYVAMLAELTEPADPPALGRFNLRGPQWKRATDSVRRRLLRDWLWKLAARDHPPGYEAAQEAVNFARRGASGSQLHTIADIYLWKDAGYLVAFNAADRPRVMA